MAAEPFNIAASGTTLCDMIRVAIAVFALLPLGCSSSAPPTDDPALAAEPPNTATLAIDAGQVFSDAAPASGAARIPDASTAALAVGNDGVGPLRPGMQASEEMLAGLFPQCDARWQRHKGREAPHFHIDCAGVHVMDVVLATHGQSGAVDHVRIYKEGFATPSGLGVGSSYTALAELTDNMVCRGVRADSGGPGIIVRDHTLCMSPLFPRVAYVLKGVVFNTGETPEGAEELRIGELRWTP